MFSFGELHLTELGSLFNSYVELTLVRVEAGGGAGVAPATADAFNPPGVPVDKSKQMATRTAAKVSACLMCQSFLS
jgi:hypothetical protein